MATTASSGRRSFSKRWVITVASLLMLLMFPVSYFLIKKTKEVKDEVTRYQQNEELLEDDYEPKQTWLTESIVIKELAIPLPHQSDPATIKVYWHNDADIFLIINSLKKLPEGEKYQVWSITNGTRKNLGLFDAPADDRLVIKAEGAATSDSYDITVLKGADKTEGKQ